MTDHENEITTDNNLLIYCDEYSPCSDAYKIQYEYLKNNFCGKVFSSSDSEKNNYLKNTFKKCNIFLCGFSDMFDKNYCELFNDNIVYIISEFFDDPSITIHCWSIVELGRVPIAIYGTKKNSENKFIAGVYYRSLFDNENYFDMIKKEHNFQTLTESTKPNNAFRKGIYLTDVFDTKNNRYFNVLRCSSNFSGPSDNFKQTDNNIINVVNNELKWTFKDSVNINHVLAQIYENIPKKNNFSFLMLYIVNIINFVSMIFLGRNIVNLGNSKDVKAKIKAHSDKTKDMPRNGVIAFCTFYESYFNYKFNKYNLEQIKKSKSDIFDFCYNNSSVLTTLKFKLKKCVNNDNLINEFSIKLYPNSVFVIPLSTNRLYTHEIVPSSLPINLIPTRLGYVGRCSNTKGMYDENNVVWIANEKYNNELIKLQNGTKKEVDELKNLYFKENTTDKIIEYPQTYFSMNDGDYKKPLI